MFLPNTVTGNEAAPNWRERFACCQPAAWKRLSLLFAFQFELALVFFQKGTECLG